MPRIGLYAVLDERKMDRQVKAAVRLLVERKYHVLRPFRGDLSSCLLCGAVLDLEDAYAFFRGHDTLGAFTRRCGSKPPRRR